MAQLRNPNSIQEQAAVGRNEQNRRRRQRQRRRGRGRGNSNGLPPRTTNTGTRRYRRSVEAENKQAEPAMEATWQERLKVADILSPELISFCESVVHPFGNAAIGATLPDKYQELVIPLTDRMEFDITPHFFDAVGSSELDANYDLVGIFCWFQPRCLAAGTTAVINELNQIAFQLVPYLGLESDFSKINMNVIHEQYVLCMTGVWRTAGEFPATFGFYDEGLPEATKIKNYYVAIEYSRFDNIDNNCDLIRILGAGIKMWSEEAPINTGGYSLGGWATLQDIYSAMTIRWINTAPAHIAPMNAGGLAAFQTSIKYACRSPGVKGSTVRYSPLQTADQLESEYPCIPDHETVPFAFNNVRDLTTNLTTAAPFDPPVAVEGISLTSNDVAKPGTFVPVIYWSFNTSLATGQVETYTVKLMSMVHSEGVPNGQSPFMSNKSNVDMATVHVKSMLENPEVFPAATGGHSFKSFMSKVRHVIAKVTKGAGSVTKILAMADSMAEKLIPK